MLIKNFSFYVIIQFDNMRIVSVRTEIISVPVCRKSLNECIPQVYRSDNISAPAFRKSRERNNMWNI